VEYEAPSAATVDAGLEGFTVLTGSERLGRVAALNRVVRVESERLVRHIPLELERLAVDGVAPAREPRSGAWYAGVLLASVGGVGVFVGLPLALDGLGGGVLRWVWLGVPLVACVAGIVLVRRSGRFGDAAVALLGISPRTRRRG
jgi:hypothetical protein